MNNNECNYKLNEEERKHWTFLFIYLYELVKIIRNIAIYEKYIFTCNIIYPTAIL